MGANSKRQIIVPMSWYLGVVVGIGRIHYKYASLGALPRKTNDEGAGRFIGGGVDGG